MKFHVEATDKFRRIELRDHGRYGTLVWMTIRCYGLALVLGCWACSGDATAPSTAPVPVDTAIHIYSIGPLVGSTIAYGIPVQLSGHYTLAPADEGKRATATVWLCLGTDVSSVIIASCTAGQQLPTADFQAATTLTSSGTARPAPTDTSAVHVLLVNGASLESGLPATVPLSRLATSVITRITIPHTIHWQ